MSGHEKRDARAQRAMHDARVMLGREIREGRLNHGLSQTSAARSIDLSVSAWSRMERGAATNVSLMDLGRALAAVGLDLHVRAYPRGGVIRDDAHVRLLERLRTLLGTGVLWRTEVPLPGRGDRRAWDGFIMVGDVRIGVEAETRARDAQELQRRISLKRRDGGVDHVILLLSDTRHNRAFLRSAGHGLRADFPLDPAIALQRLASGRDPGGSAIILL